MLTILLEYIANNCHKRKEILKYKNDKLDKKSGQSNQSSSNLSIEWTISIYDAILD